MSGSWCSCRQHGDHKTVAVESRPFVGCLRWIRAYDPDCQKRGYNNDEREYQFDRHGSGVAPAASPDEIYRHNDDERDEYERHQFSNGSQTSVKNRM